MPISLVRTVEAKFSIGTGYDNHGTTKLPLVRNMPWQRGDLHILVIHFDDNNGVKAIVPPAPNNKRQF